MTGQEDDAALQLLLGKLEGVTSRGGYWMARCPAHNDGEASLSIARGTEQPVVLNCKAGCETADVLAAIELTLTDISSPRSERQAGEWMPGGRRSIAVYDYTDQGGTLLFQVLRSADKHFSQRRPDPAAKSGWAWNLKGVRRVPYRLPKVIEAVARGEVIYICEGEKDVHAIEYAGAPATCNPGGANKWKQEYDAFFAGASVVIVADKDEPGRKHALSVATGLRKVAADVQIVEALEGKDAADHIAAGHTLNMFTPVSTEPAEREPEDGHDSQGESRGPSQASRLVALAAERYELVMSEDGRPYGVAKNGPNIAVPLRGSRGLRTRLAAIYADATRGTAPSQSALADALTVMEGYAARKEAVPVHLRLARHGDSIVLDLGTPDGRCVVVRPGSWRIEARSPVLFRRTALTSAIPDPIHDGDGLAALSSLLNTDSSTFRLLTGWMISALIPEIPHPILAFKGEQGTGKTTAARSVVQIIDPSPAPLRTAPRDVKQWVVVAAASWAVCLDNVNAISSWLSETLCRAVTGDGNVDRALYTDDDVTVLAFRRVVMMTSIDAGNLEGDLAERLLLIELQPMQEGARRTDGELTEAYGAAQPAILASLLDLAAEVLVKLPDVRPESMPRMADFACVLQALDTVKADEGWDTLGAYAAASDTIAADVLEGDQFGQAVAKLVREAAGQAWSGTAGRLLELITPDKPPKNWPKDATRAGGRLKRIAPVLRQAGISFDDSEREPQGNRSRLYSFALITPGENSAVPAPAAPAAPGGGPEQPERAGAGAGAEDGRAPAAPAPFPAAGAAGAGAGAVAAAAPASETPTDLREHDVAGAAGAAGAESASISRPTCTACGEPLDPANVKAGFTTHSSCDVGSAA